MLTRGSNTIERMDFRRGWVVGIGNGIEDSKQDLKWQRVQFWHVVCLEIVVVDVQMMTSRNHCAPTSDKDHMSVKVHCTAITNSTYTAASAEPCATRTGP